MRVTPSALQQTRALWGCVEMVLVVNVHPFPDNCTCSEVFCPEVGTPGEEPLLCEVLAMTSAVLTSLCLPVLVCERRNSG